MVYFNMQYIQLQGRDENKENIKQEFNDIVIIYDILLH